MTNPQQQDDIRLIEGLETVRNMPRMYVGQQPDAIYEVILLLVRISIFESLKSKTGALNICIDSNNFIISSIGYGIPIFTPEFIELWNKSKIGLASWTHLPVLHPAFIDLADDGMDNYIDLRTASAVAENFSIQSKRDGFLWVQHYLRGEPQDGVIKVRLLTDGEPTGTTIEWEPDKTIIDSVEVDHFRLATKIRELAYLYPAIVFTFEDQREEGKYPVEIYSQPNGLQDFIHYLNRDFVPLHEPIVIRKTLTIEPTDEKPSYSVILEIAFQYVGTHSSLVISFVNGYETERGGIHVDELLSDLGYFLHRRSAKLDPFDFGPMDMTIGLTAIVSLWHPTSKLHHATKTEFVSQDIQHKIFPLITDAIQQFAAQNPAAMQAMINHYEKEPLSRYRRRYGHYRNVAATAG